MAQIKEVPTKRRVNLSSVAATKEPTTLPVEIDRGNVWYEAHLEGMELDQCKNDDEQFNRAIHWLDKNWQMGLNELLINNETEPVSSIWMEEAHNEQGEKIGIHLWWSGLLIHEGNLPATPVTMYKFMGNDKAKEWEDLYGQRKVTPKIVYETLKSKVQNEMLEFFTGSEITYLGEEPDVDSKTKRPVARFGELLNFGPDKAAHLWINGWTGSNMEWMEHIKSLMEGIAENGDQEIWYEKVGKLIDRAMEGQDIPNEQKELQKNELLQLLRDNPGQRDPNNHMHICFGDMGAGRTTPADIRSLFYGGSPNQYAEMNAQLVETDILEQPVNALKKLRDYVEDLEYTRLLGGRDTNEITADDKRRRREIAHAKTERVIGLIHHLWPHSMGAAVIFKNTDESLPNSLVSLFHKYGNYDFRFHAWNGVSYGDLAQLSETEMGRIGEIYTGDLTPSLTFIDKSTVKGQIVRNGPQLMTNKFTRRADGALKISQRLTLELLNNIDSIPALAVHQNANLNGSQQVALNTRICDEMRFFVRSQAHVDFLRQLVDWGQLEVWNGIQDRILTFESVSVQQEILGVKHYLETQDHEIDPKQFKKLSWLVFAPRRGTLSQCIDLYDTLNGLLSERDMRELVIEYSFDNMQE